MAEKNFRVKKGLTVDGTGDSSIAGNLGIGITTPSEALHIRSSSDHPIVLENDQNAQYVGIQFSDASGSSYGQKGELRFNHADSVSQGSGASFHFTTTETELSIVGGKFISAFGTASEPGFAFGVDFDNGMFHPATNQIAFSTAGAEAVRIDASGNVGIGDTTPSSPLTIYHAVTNPALDGIGGNAFAMDINIDLSGSGSTSSGDREQGGLYIDLETSATGGDTSDEHRPYGIWVNARQKSAADADALYGIYSYTESERSSASTTATTNLAGVYGYGVSDETADNTISNLMGVYGLFSIQDAGVVTNAYGLRAHSSVHNNRSTNTGALHGCAAEIDISGTRDGNSGRSNANITTGDARVFESVFDHNVASSGEGTVSVTNSYLYYGNSSITDSAQVTNNYGVYMNGETKNYFSGNVGIGNTNPSSPLDVTGSIELSSNLHFNGAGGHYIKHEGGTASTDNFTFRFSDNEDVMIVRGDGRVGIGTTSPSVPLHVVSSGTTSLLLESTDAGAADAPILELYRNSASPANSDDLGQILWSAEKSDGSKYSITKMYGEINTVDNSDRLMINIASSGGSGLNDYEYMRFDGGVRDIIFNEFGYDIDIRMEGDSNSALFFLDASADSIGIGTTSPDSLLEVSGDSTGSITAKVTNTHDTDNTGLAVLQLENQRGADSNFYIEHNAYGQTKFYTGNSKNHSYTLEEDGDITLPDARRLQFGSDDTYIYATTDSDEHLMIAADASIWLDPDEDVVIRRAGTEWARFDGSAHSGEGQLQLGQGGDLQLYHDGSNSYIVDNGTGNLRLDGTSLWFNVAGSNIMRVESGQVKSWRDVNINDKITLDADTGALVAITKSFDIEHPTEEGKRLHHGVLEGPEHAVYIRGHQVGDTIELPDYWLGLVDEDTITVQLTAKGRSQNLYVKSVDSEKVVVGGFITKSPDFYYFIQAERKDIEKMVVEY